MAFPLSPANNQTALVNGIVYQWNNTLGVWKRNGSVNSIEVGQLLLNSAQQATTNGSGSLIVSGGAGITGNVYTGGIFITGAANGITFADGSVQTSAATNIDAYARTTANAAFDAANTKLSLSGGTITGSLTVNGNLSVLGTTTTINTSSFTVNDSLITLGTGNYTSDLLDIGISGHYNDGTNAHAGFIRDPETKEWYVFKGYTPEVTANNNVDINHASFAKANVHADYFKGNVAFSDGTIQTTAATNIDSFARITANTASSNTIYIQGVDATQNTNITAIDIKAQAAFDKANTAEGSVGFAAFDKANSANVLAQAAFNAANTAIGGAVLTSTVDTFTGNGSNTAFILSTTPATINYTTAVVGGVTQPRSAYSVIGTTLTFTSAPANNQIVEVTTIGTSNTTLYTVNNIISPFLLMGA